MRLGELLLRDGRLTEAQLSAAISAQSRDGGRLGTILLEAQVIDYETLTVYLGLELGIPIASGAALERAKLTAVRLLAPTQAFAHRIVPLVVQDRHLIAAVADPHDFANLEAVQQITGYRVLPRVAPEARIFYYIERYYGAARPVRFAKHGEAPRGDDDPAPFGLPAPPLPGLPPIMSAPTPAPGPRPHLRRSRTHDIMRAPGVEDSQALELDAEDLIDSLESDADVSAPVVSAAASVAVSAPVAAQRPATLPPPLEPMPADAALKALAAADDRNQIADVTLRYAMSLGESAVLFAVRDTFAFGWRAAGHVPGHRSVEHILMPLDPPSVLQMAADAEDGMYSGSVAPSTLHSYMFRVLGLAEPPHATVAAISIGRRHVNLLYVNRETAFTKDELKILREVCTAAAQAYARLIAVAKQKR